MILEDVLKLNGTIITKEQVSEIIQSEFIAFFKNCGASGLKIGYTWSIFTLIDGKEVNVYYKTI